MTKDDDVGAALDPIDIDIERLKRNTAREALRQRYRALLEVSVIPSPLHAGLVHYFVDHRPTGDFLQSVLANDLIEAMTRADLINRPRLPDLVNWLLMHAPAIAWGSRAAVTEWLASRELLPPDNEDFVEAANGSR